MIQELASQVTIVRHSNTVAAGTSVITPSTPIDTAGANGVLFIAEFGAIVSTAVTSVEVHQSDDSGGSPDDFTALAGSNVAVADDKDNKVVYVEVVKPSKRYLKLIVNRGTANATLEGITAIVYGHGTLPTTQGATVLGGETHVRPAEGTA